jgi:hypothetical protein
MNNSKILLSSHTMNSTSVQEAFDTNWVAPRTLMYRMGKGFRKII